MTKPRSRSRPLTRRRPANAVARVSLSPRRAIFLVGFMGAGKTVVGRALARKLGCRFLDLDDAIVECEGRSIAQIFSDAGEAAFREIETNVLAEVVQQLDGGRAVVALGGGAFVRRENATRLRNAGVHIIFLDAPVEELIERCRAAAPVRPLFRDENHFRQLYEQRRKRYMEADIRIDTASRSVEAVADQVAMAVRRNAAAKPSRRSK